MNPAKFNFILCFTLITKLYLAWKIPVFGDESYYWFWGQHIQLSYFDHPGMVGWLTWFGSQIQFLPTSLVVRWPFVFVSTLSLYIFGQILFMNKSNDTKINLWLLSFYLLNPLLGIGGILATPDVPLVFFWTLSYWIVLLILKSQRTVHYIYLGIALGLGLCSKYHIVLFPLSAIISLIFAKRISEINVRKLFLTFIFGIIFSSPVLIWNYQNEWASFVFQLNHGFQGKSYTIFWTVTYLCGQIFLFNPVLLFQLFTDVKKSVSKNMGLTGWLFFLTSSLKAGVEANWPVASHMNGLSALSESKHKKFLKPALAYSISIWIIFFIFYFSDYGQMKMQKIPNSLSAQKIWSKISTYQPMYGPTYQMSSLLQLVSGQQILKLNQLSRIDFYDSKVFKKPTDKIFYALKYNISEWPDWLKSARKNQIENFPDQDLALYSVVYE